MNVQQEVSAHLSTAQTANWKAKKPLISAEDSADWYMLKSAHISAAVLKDPNGWLVDADGSSRHVLAITYRGCWWFHVPVEQLPEMVSSILLDNSVPWLRRGVDVIQKMEGPETQDSEDSGAVPETYHYLGESYQ